jgi:hypothetical protein
MFDLRQNNDMDLQKEANTLYGPGCSMKLGQGMEAAFKKGYLEIDQEGGSKLNHSLLQAKKLNRQLGDGKVSD